MTNINIRFERAKHHEKGNELIVHVNGKQYMFYEKFSFDKKIMDMNDIEILNFLMPRIIEGDKKDFEALSSQGLQSLGKSAYISNLNKNK